MSSNPPSSSSYITPANETTGRAIARYTRLLRARNVSPKATIPVYYQSCKSHVGLALQSLASPDGSEMSKVLTIFLEKLETRQPPSKDDTPTEIEDTTTTAPPSPPVSVSVRRSPRPSLVDFSPMPSENDAPPTALVEDDDLSLPVLSDLIELPEISLPTTTSVPFAIDQLVRMSGSQDVIVLAHTPEGCSCGIYIPATSPHPIPLTTPTVIMKDEIVPPERVPTDWILWSAQKCASFFQSKPNHIIFGAIAGTENRYAFILYVRDGDTNPRIIHVSGSLLSSPSDKEEATLERATFVLPLLHIDGIQSETNLKGIRALLARRQPAFDIDYHTSVLTQMEIHLTRRYIAIRSNLQKLQHFVEYRRNVVATNEHDAATFRDHQKTLGKLWTLLDETGARGTESLQSSLIELFCHCVEQSVRLKIRSLPNASDWGFENGDQINQQIEFQLLNPCCEDKSQCVCFLKRLEFRNLF